jgi:hypothetical protein
MNLYFHKDFDYADEPGHECEVCHAPDKYRLMQQEVVLTDSDAIAKYLPRYLCINCAHREMQELKASIPPLDERVAKIKIRWYGPGEYSLAAPDSSVGDIDLCYCSTSEELRRFVRKMVAQSPRINFDGWRTVSDD